jgi:hypothetical protein
LLAGHHQALAATLLLPLLQQVLLLLKGSLILEVAGLQNGVRVCVISSSLGLTEVAYELAALFVLPQLPASLLRGLRGVE